MFLETCYSGMTMKKYSILILALAVVMIIVGVYSIQKDQLKDQSNGQAESVTVPAEEAKSQSEPQTETDASIIEKSGDDRVLNSETINEQALARLDETICLQHELCVLESACLAIIAEEKGDVAICEPIPDCSKGDEIDVSGFAYEQCIDGAVRKKVKEVSAKEDPILCSDLEGTVLYFGDPVPQKDMCLVQIATGTEDPNICDLVKNVDLKEQCLLFTD